MDNVLDNNEFQKVEKSENQENANGIKSGEIEEEKTDISDYKIKKSS